MKRILISLLMGWSVLSAAAADLPPAQKILTFARSRLPQEPVRMTGALRERAANGFPLTAKTLEMELHWGASPARAVYRLTDEDSGADQTLEIRWLADGPDFDYTENGESAAFSPNRPIEGLGMTWADLSFSFLWSTNATVEQSGKKLGKECFVLSIPRPGERRLRLWIEKATGRTLGAREYSADGTLLKDIKIVSVKEFDGLWMAKDIDIIRPQDRRRTSLRIEQVERIQE